MMSAAGIEIPEKEIVGTVVRHPISGFDVGKRFALTSPGLSRYDVEKIIRDSYARRKVAEFRRRCRCPGPCRRFRWCSGCPWSCFTPEYAGDAGFARAHADDSGEETFVETPRGAVEHPSAPSTDERRVRFEDGPADDRGGGILLCH